MGKKYNLYQVDVFTSQKFRGNPAGVVSNADGLTDKQMQQIARELNNSETAFIFPPENSEHDLRVRFFTPTMEVPTCGHATIAAHYINAVEKNLQSCSVIQKIGIRTLPVEVFKNDSDYKIFMTQGKVEFIDTIKNDLMPDILTALQLDKDDIKTGFPIQHVTTGSSKVIIGIKNRNKLNSITPDLNLLVKLSQITRCRGYFIFTLDSPDPNILSYARMFAPQIGINEDPVTGNGNGPLGAYLVKNNLVNHNGSEFKFNSIQGEAIDRPGIAEVIVEINNGNPTKVKVGGKAVIAFQTKLEI